jgi:hypothetical protein
MKQAALIASLFGVAISAEQESESSHLRHFSQIFATQPLGKYKALFLELYTAFYLITYHLTTTKFSLLAWFADPGRSE